MQIAKSISCISCKLFTPCGTKSKWPDSVALRREGEDRVGCASRLDSTASMAAPVRFIQIHEKSVPRCATRRATDARSCHALRPVTPPEVKALHFSRRKDREAFVTGLLRSALQLEDCAAQEGFGSAFVSAEDKQGAINDPALQAEREHARWHAASAASGKLM